MPSRPTARGFLPLKNDVLLILMALAEEARHGYGIIQRIDQATGGDVQLQTGALYRRLKELLGTKLLVETDAPRGEESADGRRRYYTLTPLGRAVLSAELGRMARLVRAGGHEVLTSRPRLA